MVMVTRKPNSEHTMKKKKPHRGFAEINEIKNDSNEIYLNLLGYSIKESSLKNLNSNDWNEFCLSYNLNKNSKGIYLPRNSTAVIPKNNSLSLFHEYFGHGLFCERSLVGKELVNLEKKLTEEEKNNFNGDEFSKEDLENFRRENETFNYLQNFKNQNLGIYEGFAVFSEYFLSNNFGLENLFEQKYEKLNGEFRKYFDEVISFNEKFGNLATFYGFGLERVTTPERVRKLLEEVYGDKINDIEFAVLYGSKKGFSDIDVFNVGNLENIENEWLDLRNYSKEEFEKKLNLLDVEITDPLFSGEIIFGNKNYFENCKNKILDSEISREAIKHNFCKSDEQLNLALQLEKNNPLRNNGLLYSIIYMKNALALREGKKLLTKESLVSDSHSEKFIELRTDNKLSDNPVITELKGGKLI